MQITISTEAVASSNEVIILGNEDLQARLTEGLGNSVNEGKSPLYSGLSMGFFTLLLSFSRLGDNQF